MHEWLCLVARLDPPWYLVISSGGRRYVVESRRSLAETMRADFERLRATHLEQSAPFAKS